MSKNEYYPPQAPPYSEHAPQQGYSNYYGPPPQQQPYSYQQQQPVYVQQQGGGGMGNYGPGSNSWAWCCGFLQLATCVELLLVLI